MSIFRALAVSAFSLSMIFGFSTAAQSQDATALYSDLKAFQLNLIRTDLNNYKLNRDRVEITLSGTLHLSRTAEGRITGAVFSGTGNFKLQAPPIEFEKANIKRLLGVDDFIDSDFKTAVFRFTDGAFEELAEQAASGPGPANVQSMATDINPRMLKETGANLASRLALSILNNERAGFFFAHFDGGKRGRFSYVLDPQNQIPTHNFNINAGEEGIVFKYDTSARGNDVWTAFHSLADYERGMSDYADKNDIVDVTHYEMNVDLRQVRNKIGLESRVDMKVLKGGARAIPFQIGESLPEWDDLRLKKQMRIKSASMGGTPIDFVQEDWEGGLTLFLKEPTQAGANLSVDLAFEGDFLTQPSMLPDCSYPRDNAAWYPRHGYLDRATYNFTYTHGRRSKVASTGKRTSEEADPANKDHFITKYTMNQPVALATFAVGPFERHSDQIKWDNGDPPIPLEFNSVSGGVMAIKESFILAELNNSIRYFQETFGKYPYETYGALVHPYGFGQGFATMLAIPPTDRASKYTYEFIAHETAHQWWGNIVAWRSYRDQWLSEGFAEYSGVLYTQARSGRKDANDLLDDKRRSLREPPRTQTGIGRGKLVDVGPMTLGHRLETRQTRGAYSTLVYNKGALVLRMLHFLLTDPQTGDGKAFFNMMKDFVGRYRDKAATTDDFRMVAGEHFARSPIGRRYNAGNLDWFFRQWVEETYLPSYRLEYQVNPNPEGGVIVSGTVHQENVGEKWFMPLPIIFKFGGNRSASGTVAAYEAKNTFSIKLPEKPQSIEFDPDRWVLSEKTTAK